MRHLDVDALMVVKYKGNVLFLSNRKNRRTVRPLAGNGMSQVHKPIHPPAVEKTNPFESKLNIDCL